MVGFCWFELEGFPPGKVQFQDVGSPSSEASKKLIDSPAQIKFLSCSAMASGCVQFGGLVIPVLAKFVVLLKLSLKLEFCKVALILKACSAVNVFWQDPLV